MPALTVPDEVERERVRVDPEPRATQADARHEETVTNLEEKERGVAVSPEPVAVRLDEADDLVLREAEIVQVRRKRAEHLLERRVLDHLVNNDFRLIPSFARNIGAVASKVVADESEDALGPDDRSLAVGRLEHDPLAERDAAKPELGQFGDHLPKKIDRAKLELQPAAENLLGAILVDDAGSEELFHRLFSRFLEGVRDEPSKLVLLTRRDGLICGRCNRLGHRYHLSGSFEPLTMCNSNKRHIASGSTLP